MCLKKVLLPDIIEGRMQGKAYQLHMLSDVASSAKYSDVKKTAEDRAGWRATNSRGMP